MEKGNNVQQTKLEKMSELEENDPNKTDNVTTDFSEAIHYKVEDVPPWYLCLLLGFQHYLMMFGGTVTFPYLVTAKMCMPEGDPARGYMISTTFFVSGIATLLQSTFGTRLPIIQGCSFTLLIPTLSILSLPHWKCPSDEDIISNRAYSEIINSTIENSTMATYYSDAVTDQERQDVWLVRMREIQGAIIIACLFECFLGFTGLIGLFLRWITPITITPVITLIGLSLFEEAAAASSTHWGVAVFTMVMLVGFSQYCHNANLPCVSYNSKKGFHRKGFPIFKLFPVLLTIVIAWLLCVLLTATDAIDSTSKIRTDSRWGSMDRTPWFRVPYPGQWGKPTFSAGAILGMIAGAMSSIIESIGDYYACAKMSGAPPPPCHALNRGIFFEGIGSVCAGIWGSGNGMTSFSENIGAIGVTKVASRRVIQYGGLLMIGFGIIAKFGTLFVVLPDPILGGVFTVMFAMVTGVGVSNLQYINLNSNRNVFIVGAAMFMGICIPKWMKAKGGMISTGNEMTDQIVTILLSTGIFVAGFIGIFLDNTIPGTREERGMDKWRSQDDSNKATTSDNESEKLSESNCYNLPFGMAWIEQHPILRYLPISPTYREDLLMKKISWRRKEKEERLPTKM